MKHETLHSIDSPRKPRVLAVSAKEMQIFVGQRSSECSRSELHMVHIFLGALLSGVQLRTPRISTFANDYGYIDATMINWNKSSFRQSSVNSFWYQKRTLKYHLWGKIYQLKIASLDLTFKSRRSFELVLVSCNDIINLWSGGLCRIDFLIYLPILTSNNLNYFVFLVFDIFFLVEFLDPYIIIICFVYYVESIFLWGVETVALALSLSSSSPLALLRWWLLLQESLNRLRSYSNGLKVIRMYT